MWKKSLDARPITSIASDRICGLRIKLPSPAESEITVLAVYLPCADMDIECYGEQLVELERLISESQCFGPVVITGDFNAHLGTLGGARGQGSPNTQGILLHHLLDRCKLYAVSLCSLSALNTHFGIQKHKQPLTTPLLVMMQQTIFTDASHMNLPLSTILTTFLFQLFYEFRLLSLPQKSQLSVRGLTGPKLLIATSWSLTNSR